LHETPPEELGNAEEQKIYIDLGVAPREVNDVVDNIEYCKVFVNNNRKLLFNDFLTTNNIAAQEFETITLSDEKVITLAYKNKDLDIDQNYTLDISAGASSDDIIKFAEASRENIKTKKAIAEEKKSIENISGSLLDLVKK
jgi:hypothetical protein